MTVTERKSAPLKAAALHPKPFAASVALVKMSTLMAAISAEVIELSEFKVEKLCSQCGGNEPNRLN